MGSVLGGVVDLVSGILGGGGEAQAPSKQAYGGQFADESQTGYQAKSAKTARAGASDETLLTQGGDLGTAMPDTTAPASSDLGDSTGAAEKQAQAGKRRDEIASKLYGN
jgi:hypothetical protein